MRKTNPWLIYYVSAIMTIVAGCEKKTGSSDTLLKVQMLPSPAGAGSGEPNLFTAADGRIFLSWIEAVGDKSYALRFAIREESGWSKPQTIAVGDNWFVNWADFPSLVAFADGSLAAHWLAKSGQGTYAYDVNIAYTMAGGNAWSKPIVPHSDGTQTEHGFVSMLPWQNDRLFVVWLDGRNFAENTNGHAGHGAPTDEMMLRFATLDNSGELHDETLLDPRVCECCQTSAALTSDGAVVVYRDRSPEEIRDIGIVRYQNGAWTEPALVNKDGWVHPGCPVNGPSMDAESQRVVVAWFTMANDSPRVKVAFSNDGGETFGQPIAVDDGDPLGRVDVILLPDHSALVSWLEATDNEGEIRLRRVQETGARDQAITIAESSTKRASGFPRMARNDREIIFAWTQPGSPSTVRTAFIEMGSYQQQK
jgi:hypothetical protein